MPDPSPSHDADLLQQLRRQYQEVSELAGALAHEIKNPLSVIGMNVELMAEELADVELPQTRRALIKLDIVQKQCHRLERMLDDFLRFAKVRNLNLTPGSLNEQIERVLNLFAPQAKETGVEIIRYLDPDLPSILLDEQTLEGALVNLVKNCLEATSAGDQLIARTRLTKSGVALDLIDTGRGMEEGTALHMFDPFYSTKESGSGLGLPTARKGIEAHGGRIHVQSELGRGTKFSIEFPMPVRLHATERDAIGVPGAGGETAPQPQGPPSTKS